MSSTTALDLSFSPVESTSVGLWGITFTHGFVRLVAQDLISAPYTDIAAR